MEMTTKTINSSRQILLSILFFICSTSFDIYAQKKDKIQIVLLGTFHLTPSSEDVYKNKKIDLNSPKKQKEIQEIVSKLVTFNPSQICLEYPMENQSEMDSIYNAYKIGRYKLRDNERDLFGFQAVRELNIRTPTCK